MSFYNSLRTVSSTSSEYWEDSMEALIDAQFDSSPTVKTVLHNGTSVVVRVVGKFSKETLNRNNDDYQKIIFKDYDYSVNVGDLFVFDNLTWLCTGVASTAVSKSCSVQLCNNTLSFYSPTDSILYSIPCIITNKITLDESENNYLSTVNNEVYMMCSSSTITRQIKPNDIFQLGVYNYKVLTVFDDITIPGILIFKMKYSEEEATTHTFAVNILNGPTISIKQGTTLQLNTEVTDGGVVLSPAPTVTYNSSNIAKATVSSTGLITALATATGNCTITATSNGVSDTITVTIVATSTNNYTYSLSSTSMPDNEIRLNQTKTFTAQKYNNGVVISQGFTFGVSGDSTAYTLTTVDGNTCTVKSLKSGYTIVLSATDISDVTKVTTKNIVLKSVF